MAKGAITLIVVEKAIVQAMGSNPPNRPKKMVVMELAEQVDRLQDRGTDLDNLISVAVHNKLQARPAEPYVATLRQLFVSIKSGSVGRSRYDKTCVRRNRPQVFASTA